MDNKELERRLENEEYEFYDSEITPEIQLDMFQSIKGKDEDGNSNCIVMYRTFSFEKMTPETYETMTTHDLLDRLKTGIEKGFGRADVEVNISSDFMEVCLTFETALSPDIRLLLNQLDIFKRNRTAFLLNETNELPQFEMMLYPRKYNHEKYILCAEPLFYALQPEKAGMQNLNKMIIVFPLDAVTFEMVEALSEEERRETESYLERTETDAFLFDNRNA